MERRRLVPSAWRVAEVLVEDDLIGFQVVRDYAGTPEYLTSGRFLHKAGVRGTLTDLEQWANETANRENNRKG